MQLNLDTIELWKLLTVVRNSREFGHGSELAIEIEREIAKRLS
jgi:hypothetical protein